MKKLHAPLNWMALLLVVFLAGSCAKSILYWNQAIKSFEQGAEMELQNRFAARLDVQGDLPAEALPDLNGLVPEVTADIPAAAGPEAFYQMADEKITQALAAPGPLEKENKMGNALTIKALTSWKTGQMDAARTNAQAALEALARSGEANPRDLPLAKAIPGLVALDLAYDSTHQIVGQLKAWSDTAPDDDRADNEARLETAVNLYREYVSEEDSEHSIAAGRAILQEAMDMAGENQEIKMYLQLSEMAGLKNRFDFWAQLNNFAKRSRLKSGDEELKNWLDEEERTYLEAKDEALDRLKQLLDGDVRHDAYRFWDGIL